MFSCVALTRQDTKFGYDGSTCQAVYEAMLDGVYQSIVEAKTNPNSFRAKRHRATRCNERAPWSVRI